MISDDCRGEEEEEKEKGKEEEKEEEKRKKKKEKKKNLPRRQIDGQLEVFQGGGNVRN